VPIGAVQKCLPSRSHSGPRSLLKPIYPTAYSRFYGTEDLHTHIRWRAIKPLVFSACLTGAEVILDVGCGDGSTDKSCEVAERYAKSDPRIKLLRKGNGGVSSALNGAYRKSGGERHGVSRDHGE
jgi:hypothetical protein